MPNQTRRMTLVNFVCLSLVFTAVAGCGAGATKPEDIDKFYTRYDYLVGQNLSEAGKAFTVRQMREYAGADEGAAPHETYAAIYEVDASMQYVGYELDPNRAAENQAALTMAGQTGFAPPGIETMLADPSELQPVLKEDACSLRIYVDELGQITKVQLLGDVYTIRLIDPVPTACTKRLDALVGYSPGPE